MHVSLVCTLINSPLTTESRRLTATKWFMNIVKSISVIIRLKLDRWQRAQRHLELMFKNKEDHNCLFIGQRCSKDVEMHRPDKGTSGETVYMHILPDIQLHIK